MNLGARSSMTGVRDAATVVIVSVVEVGPPFGVTVGGEKLHTAIVGRPEHANETCWLKPFEGVTVITDCPEPPGGTLIFAELLSVKSGTATATVIADETDD